MLCWFRRSLVLLLAASAASAEVSPEVQICLQHLEPSQRASLARTAGPLEDMPLYRVQLELDPKARQVRGQVQVHVRAKGRPLTSLYLRATPNAFGSYLTLSQSKANGQPVKLQALKPDLYQVPLEPAVPVGAEVVVQVALEAQVPRGKVEALSLLGALGGTESSGGTDYGAFSALDDFISLVGVVPMVSPVDGQGRPWEGPSGLGDLALYEPSHFMAAITVPNGWRVHATGAPMGEEAASQGRVRFSFAAAAVRDFPVFASRGYASESAQVGHVRVESWYSAKDAAVGRRVLRYATGALEAMQRRLGPLPWTHLRVVEAPLAGGAGGMEFSGLFTIGTSLYAGVKDPSSALSGGGLEQLASLLGPEVGELLKRLGGTLEQTLEFTVAHELAHQYFPGLVGSDPIASPVVDEPLTQYVALLALEWQHGKKAAEQMRKMALVSTYHLYRMTGGKDGPADRPTSAFSDNLQYAALVYGKAPLLHHASRQLVGDEAFVSALRSYVDKWRLRWTCTECFTQELAKASPGSASKLEALRVRWWKQAHGDEDLGAPNRGEFAELLGGGGEVPPMDPKSLEQLEELMKQMERQ
jgi:hypothetical protein